jgi:signal transduction histidine kinase
MGILDKMKKLLVLLFLGAVFFQGSVKAEVALDHESKIVNISSQVYLGRENPVQNSDQTIALGYFNGEKWLQFNVKNLSDQHLKKYLYFSSITGFIQVYEKDQENLVLKKTFGSSVPGLQQDHASIYSITDFELQPKQEKTLYLKVSSRHNFNTSLFVGSLEEIKAKEAEVSLFYYIYLGAILALVFYNLFIYAYLKENAYLRYCIFSVSFMATLSVIKGYADLFFANHLFSFSHYLMFFSGFSVLSASGFTYYFLEIYKKNSICKKIFKAISVSSILFMLVSLTSIEDHFPLYFGVAIDCLVALSNIFFIYMAIVNWKQMAAAKFYLLSWLFVFAAVFVWFGMTFGLFSQNFLTLNSLLLANIAQMITLSLAIAYRMHQLKADKIIAEEKAFQKDRYQRLVRVLSHDIANSLSVVLLQAEKLTRGQNFSQENLQATYQKIIFAGNNIKKMLDGVRDQEKINSELSQNLHMQVFKLDSVFSEAHLIFEEKLHSKNISLDINLEDNLRIKADRVCFLNQIVCNILSNAIKFSIENSKIEIKAFLQQDRICLQFIDYGVGIEGPFLAQMLKANRLVSTTGTSNEVGHGFGLPIIRDYVEFFGGSFEIHSVSAAASSDATTGTRITLLFPLASF